MTTDNQEEVLIVVNDNDDILDHLPRKIVHEKKLLHRTISITLFNDQGEILLQKRSTKKDNNPGMLGNAAGGHVGKDENYDQAAREEIREELGINPELIFIKKLIINDPKHTTMTSLYKTFHNGPFDFNKDEVDEVKFYSMEDIKKVIDKLSESTKITLHEQGVL